MHDAERLSARGFHKLAAQEFRQRALEKMADQPSYEQRLFDRLVVALTTQLTDPAEIVERAKAIMKAKNDGG